MGSAAIDKGALEAATTEYLSHRGEQPRRIVKGGSELWEWHADAMSAAITAYLAALPTEEIVERLTAAAARLKGITDAPAVFYLVASDDVLMAQYRLSEAANVLLTLQAELEEARAEVVRLRGVEQSEQGSRNEPR